ncbi:unnamed protein product, partial [Dovyalis caffra]
MTDEGLRGRRPRSWCPCEVIQVRRVLGVVMAASEGREGFGGAVGKGSELRYEGENSSFGVYGEL